MLSELADLMPQLLSEGISVQLDELDILSVTLEVELKDTPEEVNESTIKSLRVQFRADTYLKQKVGPSKFKRVKG